jgi:hypothetical protein
MFTESAGDLAQLSAEYHQRHSPANSAEHFIVDTLISNEWRRRRLRCVEADLRVVATNLVPDTFPDKQPGDDEPAGSRDAIVNATGPFRRLQRVVNSYERNYRRALKELQGIEVARGHALRTPQSEQFKPDSTFSASFCNPSQTPPPAAPRPAPAPPSDGLDTPANPAEPQPFAPDRGPTPPPIACKPSPPDSLAPPKPSGRGSA